MSEFLNYISQSEDNFNVSLHRLPESVSFFSKLDQQIIDMSKHLNAPPNLTAKHSFRFIATFLLVAQRQMRNAFSLFLRRMSYDGLLLFRVALESTVFAYRIFKEPQLLSVWALKNKDWKNFTKKFRRDKFPNDMPFRTEIRRSLDTVNNYWAHPNIDYFIKVLVFASESIQVHSFDHDDDKFHQELLWFLDNCLKIIAVFRKILEGRSRVFITSTESDYQQLMKEFQLLKRKYLI